MPRTIHTERHFTASDTVRDVVIGMSDGLTVPFALAAGLSGAVSQSNIVITAGLAEIVAGGVDADSLLSDDRRQQRPDRSVVIDDQCSWLLHAVLCMSKKPAVIDLRERADDRDRSAYE